MKKKGFAFVLVLLISFISVFYVFSQNEGGTIPSLLNNIDEVVNKTSSNDENIDNSNVGNKNNVNEGIIETKEVNELPVLMYHNISINKTKLNDGTVSPDKFREDMLYLKALGYTTILPKELVAYKEGKSNLPDNPVLITFDDGYKSNYDYAFPILKELNMKAVISIIGWSVGRDTFPDNKTPIIPHFNWEEAKEMYMSGLIDIQAHSYNLHNPAIDGYGQGVLPRKKESKEDYAKRFRADTLKLKKFIEKYVGNEVLMYTYPYGKYTELTNKIIEEEGFKISLSINPGISNITDDLFLLNRINMPSESSVDSMRRILKEQNKDLETIPFSDINSSEERIQNLLEMLELE